MRRVVITGMGIVSPLGAGLDHNWSSLLAGVSGIKKITNFEVDDLACKIAGLVPLGDGQNNTLNPDDWVEPSAQRRIDPFILYGIIAALMAVKDSGWIPETEEQKCRTGVIMGSGIGGVQAIYKTSRILDECGPRRVSPFFIPSALINLISGHVSIQCGFKGPNHSVVTACSTGAHAIGDAARMIKYGDADVMVAGGAEAAICRLGMAGFVAARALSTGYNDTPEKASRPWDKGRDGFVMGEGAGTLLLEEYEHAKARGARIYGEVKGYGLSGDAHHITAPTPDGDGGFRAMSMAIKDAGLMPEHIDYVNAHGTSTPLGDVIEAGSVSRVFAGHLDTMSMSSSKSATGHLLGAAGAIEAIFTTLAIYNDVMPPTINLDDPEDAVAGLDLIPHVARKKTVRNAMSNSFGFGGTNASIILGKVD
ncbi:MAG: beta-ketoacyl-ACP synthase II [Candidatus Puniceispirillales bacterium WSBS_2018_MAG_OTU23]